MTGNNTIELNQATMRIAIQYWFDKVLFRDGQSPTVDNVVVSSKSYENTFQIAVKEKLLTNG